MLTLIKNLVSAILLVLTILSPRSYSSEAITESLDYRNNNTNEILATYEYTLGLTLFRQIQDTTESDSESSTDSDFSKYQECFYHFKSAFRYGSFNSCLYLATLHEIAANNQFQFDEEITRTPLEHLRAAKTHYNLAIIFKTVEVADVKDSLKRIDLQIKDIKTLEENKQRHRRWL